LLFTSMFIMIDVYWYAKHWISVCVCSLYFCLGTISPTLFFIGAMYLVSVIKAATISKFHFKSGKWPNVNYFFQVKPLYIDEALMSLLTGISVKCKLFPLSFSQDALLVQSQVKSCLVVVVQLTWKRVLSCTARTTLTNYWIVW